MSRQIKLFLTALMFLTRLPVPKNIDHSEELLQESPRYFPVVGYVVGAIGMLVLLLFCKVVSMPLAVLAAMIAGILTTGCFHEDGFADTCDAFGGGWTKEKILLIMKDSRLGTYGVAGLVLMLGAKFLLLNELLPFFLKSRQLNSNSLKMVAGIFLSAHALSRVMPVLVIQTYAYVTSSDGSKSKPLASRKLGLGALAFTILTGCLPLLLLPWPFWLAVFPMVLSTFLLANYFKKWIGGYTGDCLGSVQQVSEIVFYFSMLMIWRFIW